MNDYWGKDEKNGLVLSTLNPKLTWEHWEEKMQLYDYYCKCLFLYPNIENVYISW